VGGGLTILVFRFFLRSSKFVAEGIIMHTKKAAKKRAKKAISKVAKTRSASLKAANKVTSGAAIIAALKAGKELVWRDGSGYRLVSKSGAEVAVSKRRVLSLVQKGALAAGKSSTANKKVFVVHPEAN
jgi:hypothetical protein